MEPQGSGRRGVLCSEKTLGRQRPIFNQKNGTMKKQISWWALLVGAGIAYGLGALVGGIIGAALGTLGLIFLLLGIYAGIRALWHKGKSQT
jgi:hypothetical protein